MKQFSAKFRLIFIPFIIVAVSTIGIYTLLNWLILIKLKLFNVNDEVVNFFIPFALPWIPLLIWLKPRLKLLKLKTNGRNDPITGLLLVTWIAIATPAIISQLYLITATGKLTRLNLMSEIYHQPPTKYYMVRQVYVNKRMAHVKPVFGVSGKYNSDFDMYIYVAVPAFDHIFPDTNRIAALRDSINPKALFILNGKLSNLQLIKKLPADSIEQMRVLNPSFVMPKYGDSGRYGALLVLTRGYQKKDLDMPSVKISPAAWLTIKFQKTISNSLSGNEKEQMYKQFAMQCEQDFEAKNFNQFVYLDQIPYGKDLKNYQSAIAARNDVMAGADGFILSGVDAPFAARNGDKLIWIFGSLSIGTGVFLLILQFIKIRNTANVKAFYKRKPAGGNSFKNLLWPKPGFIVTPIIINLNLVIFIIMVCGGLGFVTFDAADLLTWGGNYRPAINNGEYWRLLTNMFLHNGLMHIALNMYGLLFVGIMLEPLLGYYKYAALYLVTGILASVTSVWWHPATVSVGASGAIFGLYGVFLALLTTNLFPAGVKKSFLLNTAVFVGYNLLFGLAGGIDNAAHIGGLLSGLVGGYVMYPFLKKDILPRADETEVNSAAENKMLNDEHIHGNVN